MKYKSLEIHLVLICLGLFFSISVKAQKSFDPPEIKGGSSQVYQGLKIEITAIKRVQEYQAYFRGKTIPRGRKKIAQEGKELAVIQIHTTNLLEKESNGFYLHGISIFDSVSKEYDGNQSGPGIGSLGDAHNQIYKENDFEFIVEIPKGLKFSAVQLRRAIYRDTQPYVVIQKITFGVVH